MKKPCIILIVLALAFLCAQGLEARQKITLSLESSTAGELFGEVERLSSLRVYYNPLDTAGLRISINCEDLDAAEALSRALSPCGLNVSAFGEALFVLRGKDLVTALPDGYFRETGAGPVDISSLIPGGGRAGSRASSENIVYEIGNAAAGDARGRNIVSGQVTDFSSGEPIAGIAVFTLNPMIGTTTGADGFYSIELPAGRYELNIQGMGMKDTRRQLQVYSAGRLDIELDEQVYSLGEVMVSSERLARVRTTTIGMERLAIKDMKNMPTAFGEVDIMKVVLSLPGVKSVGEAASGFNVRGGATDQNLILFNGGTVYNPTHLFGFFSAFNPDVIRDMELYKSSIPPGYGGRISSVLDVNSREGDRNGFQGSASLGLLTSRLSIEGPVGDKTSYILGGRTTYSDWILRSLPEKSGYSSGNAGFYDMNATISHRFDERNSLHLNGYFSRDRFNFNAWEHYAYRNANASARWRSVLSDKMSGTFSAGYDHYDYSVDNTDNPAEAYTMAFAIEQLFAKGGLSWIAADRHTVDFGISGLLYDLNPGSYLPEGGESLVTPNRMQREKAVEAAVYVDEKWDVTPELSVNAGLRYSLFGAMGPRTFNIYDNALLPSLNTITSTETKGGGIFKTYQGPEYRLSARYAFADDLSLKAGVNTMRQYIHKLSNTTVMSPTDTWKLSDANVLPQSGTQIAAGIYKNFAGHTVETSIEGYYKTMDNYPDYRKGAELLMNPHIETDILTAQGRAYGVELMIRKTQGRLNGWASYTYSRTMLRQADKRIDAPVNDGEWYPADFDKPHDFKMAGNYKFTHRFSLSMNLDYSTGRPVTLPVSKYQMAGGEFVYYSERNQYRIPDFFRIDLSINIEPSHHLTLLTHSSFSLGVYNVTGRKNAYSVYYVAEEGKLQGYRLAIFGMPIPYISYNIKF
ncbi:MAG: TonB-dependent receptor [Tannerellaceae bacterium]|jgi:outer membrane cobalamin receptor|nr:TonB-dependent receptor [Tannerellaceae bacterium]